MELELDAAGRVHLFTGNAHMIREDGEWTTAHTLAEPRSGSLALDEEGHAYILLDELLLLTNASGEWSEQQLGE